MEIFAIPAAPGVLGMAAIPGRGGDPAPDVAAIAAWGAALVLSMTAAGELHRVHGGGAVLPGALARHGIAWRHLPVPDFATPEGSTLADWPGAAAEAHALLDAGGRVLVHCFGGCGRSGMATLRLLVERGEDPVAALRRMRAIRPCAVETEGQFHWAAGPASA